MHGKQKFLISPQTTPLLLCALNKKRTISLLFAQYSEIVHSFVCIRSHHGIGKNIKNILKTKESTIKLPTLLWEFKPHQIIIIYFGSFEQIQVLPFTLSGLQNTSHFYVLLFDMKSKHCIIQLVFSTFFLVRVS